MHATLAQLSKDSAGLGSSACSQPDPLKFVSLPPPILARSLKDPRIRCELSKIQDLLRKSWDHKIKIRLFFGRAQWPGYTSLQEHLFQKNRRERTRLTRQRTRFVAIRF